MRVDYLLVRSKLAARLQRLYTALVVKFEGLIQVKMRY